MEEQTLKRANPAGDSEGPPAALPAPRAARAALLAAVVVALAACRGADAPVAATPADAVYPLRGIVEGLPEPGDARHHLTVRHEAVPGFVSATGETVGMGSMTMTFPVADGAELAGIAVGDKIAFDLEIRWTESDPTLLRNVLELATDTVLSFETPPTGSP